MTRSSIRAAFLGTVSALALTGAAQAGTMMETEDFNLLIETTSLGTTSDTQTVQFDQFDPILGTLTGVQIDLESFATASGILSGSDPVSGIVNVSGSLDATLEMDLDFLGTGAELTSTAITDSGDCGADGDSPAFCGDLLISSETFDGTFGVNAADFAWFIGTGTFDVDLVADFTLACTENGSMDNCSFTSGTNLRWFGVNDLNADWGVKVTYTYDPVTVPVPEPGTLALFGAGLFGLALFRRRRRAEQGSADGADGARR